MSSGKLNFKVEAMVADETSDNFQDKLYKITLEHSERSLLKVIEQEILRIVEIGMLAVNPRLITRIDLGSLTRQLQAMGLRSAPASAIPQDVRNALTIGVSLDFRKYVGKELVYENKNDDMPMLRHLSLAVGESSRPLSPNVIMCNVPLPSKATSKCVRFTGIKLRAILSSSKCIPICPWKEIDDDPRLYIFSTNAKGVTFHSAVCVKGEEESTLTFNHQSYDLPFTDLSLLRDYIKSEFDILSDQKKFTHPTNGIMPNFITYSLIELYFVMGYRMSIDISIANDALKIDVTHNGNMEQDEIYKMHAHAMDELKKITINFLDQMIKAVRMADIKQLSK